MGKSSRSLWTAKLTGTGSSSARKNTAPRTGKPYSGLCLGIDPSLRGTGLAVLRFENGQCRELLETCTVRNAPGLTMPECTANIYRQTLALCERHPLDCAAMEGAIYVQNFQTAIILGAARGSAMAAVATMKLPVYEYPPLRVKQAVTGLGRATKEQVAQMVRSLCKSPDEALPYDEADAAAVAICHAATFRS